MIVPDDLQMDQTPTEYMLDQSYPLIPEEPSLYGTIIPRSQLEALFTFWYYSNVYAGRVLIVLRNYQDSYRLIGNLDEHDQDGLSIPIGVYKNDPLVGYRSPVGFLGQTYLILRRIWLEEIGGVVNVRMMIQNANGNGGWDGLTGLKFLVIQFQ
jgi:hypothetical protein